MLLHFLDIFMTVLRIFLHLPELYFSHTEQLVNKKSGGTKMMNRLFKRGMVIALAAAMTTSAGIPAMAAQKETPTEQPVKDLMNLRSYHLPERVIVLVHVSRQRQGM